MSPDRWSVLHPEWKKQWHKSLVFPAAGKNRTTVDADDIARLDDGEFLNDNLISFYIRYLHLKMEVENPELLSSVYFFNTFFFEKLRSTKGKINYEGVKAWTAKLDLLSYKYIVVPVNENAHWYMAIICNAPNALYGIPEDDDVVEVEYSKGPESPDVKDIQRVMSDVSIRDVSPRLGANLSSPSAVSSPPPRTPKAGADAAAPHVDPRLPKIVTLDSLGSPHPATCKALKEYLIEEAKDKKGAELARIPNGMTAKRIPEQDNFCDCGVYVLGYMEEFLKNPSETVRRLLQKEPMNWVIRPSILRNDVRDLLFKFQEEQQVRLEGEKRAKRQQLAQKKAAVNAKHESGETASPAKETPVKSISPLGHDIENNPTAESHQAVDDKEETSTEDNSHRYSTPIKRTLSGAVNGERDVHTTTDSLEDAEISFIKQLPSSATEGSQSARPQTPEHDNAHRTVVTDGDVVTLSSRRRSRQPLSPLSSTPSHRGPLRSSQSESPRSARAARYDGIQRHVDLT